MIETIGSVLLIFTLIIAAGFVPALIWLWLVLKEDRVHPEPRLRLTLSFLAGMGAVIAVLPVQDYMRQLNLSPGLTLVLFAASEELFKFWFAYMSGLRSKFADEPVDEVIYLATTALGFAALENSFFLAKPFLDGNITQALIIAHVRFLGSTLVHVTSSSMIGIYLAKVFYQKRKQTAIGIGLVFAIGLHSIYNFFIMNSTATSVLNTFIGLWIVCFALVLVLNHIKKHLSHE